MAEDMPPNPSAGGGLNTKLGPLPYWGWLGLVAAGAVVGMVWWRSRKSATATDAQTGAAQQLTSGSTDGLQTEQYESLLALLRDLQGQPSTADPGDPAPDPGTGGANDPGNPRPIPHPGFSLNVTAGEHVTAFTDQLRARLGFDPQWELLETVNSSLHNNVNWGPSGSKDLNARTFKSSGTYYIPPL